MLFCPLRNLNSICLKKLDIVSQSSYKISIHLYLFYHLHKLISHITQSFHLLYIFTQLIDLMKPIFYLINRISLCQSLNRTQHYLFLIMNIDVMTFIVNPEVFFLLFQSFPTLFLMTVILCLRRFRLFFFLYNFLEDVWRLRYQRRIGIIPLQVLLLHLFICEKLLGILLQVLELLLLILFGLVWGVWVCKGSVRTIILNRQRGGIFNY